ncbi:MAG: 4-hydroxythreonine-4-phosphate dehydrogenase PdxA [Phycisphaeraceae bacterium]|nr:MAG: 4-hydroxythreonine-4-phosphate dehydrogenase PdxA [Phycisphaeraceae bacterium]
MSAPHDQQATHRPRIAVTLGDPGGIGPEVVARALADPGVRDAARWVVLGHEGSWRRALAMVGAGEDPPGIEFVGERLGRGVRYGSMSPDPPASPDAGSGECSFRAVEDAAAMARLTEGDPRRVRAIVTGPISKAAWSMAGHGEHPGHTELLGSLLGAARVGMLFHVPAAGRWSALNVMLATVHVPLTEVPGLLTEEGVRWAIESGARWCEGIGVAGPRVAVCGLNPHAGEGGLLGEEDARIIGPAIAAARADGVDVSGPWPGDTVFTRAYSGAFDLVVAMYHDQGLIPVKLIGWDRAVNVTVGLPVPRTSPDHGTAFDLAWRGTANPGSMASAMRLAARLART